MPIAHHELLDVDQQIFDTSTILTASTHGMPQLEGANWSVRMHRLRGGLSDGVDVVTLHNGRMQLRLLPTRGMGIWNGHIDGIPLQWNSPVKSPVHPAFVDPMRRGGIGWLDGFNELLCRCGLGWHGAPGTDVRHDAAGNIVSEQFLPLHGRIANLPAHRVIVSVSDADGGSVSVTGMIDEASVFGGHLRLQSTLTTFPNSNRFQIIDTITNLADTAAEVEMLYHCNVGEPFLEAGSVFHSVVTEVAPRDARATEGISMWNLCQGPTHGFAEQVYFMQPQTDDAGMGIGVLSNADSDKAFCVRFDTSTLPYFALWKNTQGTADGYVAGLEPASSFPNLRSVERRHGRVIQLAASAKVQFRLNFEMATDRDQVRQLLDEVTARQVKTPRVVHSTPRSDWNS